ncbi:hypothetical protein MmazTMA_31070 [Methanosarcina mazei]|nr:hypothetical protein MmazTMA_31070 [Methanosarcina mazei]
MYISIQFQFTFAVDAMEVHGINSYGKDPFVSTGTVICLKYYTKKSISIEHVKIK